MRKIVTIRACCGDHNQRYTGDYNFEHVFVEHGLIWHRGRNKAQIGARSCCKRAPANEFLLAERWAVFLRLNLLIAPSIIAALSMGNCVTRTRRMTKQIKREEETHRPADTLNEPAEFVNAELGKLARILGLFRLALFSHAKTQRFITRLWVREKSCVMLGHIVSINLFWDSAPALT